ncbi:MAG TPA: hypothetical protein VMZ53_09160 [Kofleriaceae bacterium]|nr:hypothetical protein [Kofleriaceae bacterium]
MSLDSRDNDEGSEPRRAPGVMIQRVCGSLQQLLARGVADYASDRDDVIELFLEPDEIAEGGMIVISMRVDVNSPTGVRDELFSAWLAVRPNAAEGTLLTPSAWLPDMVRRVYFRVRAAQR